MGRQPAAGDLDFGVMLPLKPAGMNHKIDLQARGVQIACTDDHG